MTEPLLMLDRALDIGRRELASLLSGDLDEAERLARDRGELISAALAPGAGLDRQGLLDKLKELKALQDSLTEQVARLREEARAEMLKTKQEGRRMDGYRSGVRMDMGIRSRFVSKRG